MLPTMQKAITKADSFPLWLLDEAALAEATHLGHILITSLAKLSQKHISQEDPEC